MRTEYNIISKDIEVGQPFHNTICIRNRWGEESPFINLDFREARFLIAALEDILDKAVQDAPHQR